MFYLIIKAALSGVIIAAVSEVAKRSPGLGALIASLPLISILGMIWLWRDTRNPERLAAHAGPDKIVLSHCSVEEALTLGAELGITLFQGWHVDALLRGAQPLKLKLVANR